MTIELRQRLFVDWAYVTKKTETVRYTYQNQIRFRTAVQVSLVDHIAIWCRDHLSKPYMLSQQQPFEIEFQSDADAVLFKMRWHDGAEIEDHK